MLHNIFSRFMLVVLLLCCLSLLLVTPMPLHAASGTIVISQVYGGGGNSGATLKNDFIELYNLGGSPIDVTGWSVQYGSSAGTTWSGKTILSGIIAPGHYYLVQEAQGAGGSVNLPTPDAIGTIAMSATAGKVALVNNSTTLTGTCPTGSTVDLVGYGSANCSEGSPAPTLTNTTAALRALGGCTDTDDNSADFAAGAPNPRNSASPAAACGGPTNPSATGAASPNPVAAGGSLLLTVAVAPGTNPTSTGLAVSVDLSALSGSALQSFFDDGSNGDVTAGDSIFSFSFTVPNGATPGSIILPVTVSDAQGRSGTASITVNILPPHYFIHEIQGATNRSPLFGQPVLTDGIVTAIRSNGFFIQDPNPDADPNTSEGVFVFTSSAPPAAAALGNRVQVSGTVSEFPTGPNPDAPSLTEISGSPSVTLMSAGNPLPAPVTLTAADTNPAGGLNQTERFEGMRVHVDALTTVAPTGGNLSEANATSTSNGTFYAVIAGVARPFREPGIDVAADLPAGSPCCVPRFDDNPELLRVVSSGQVGATKLDVTSNVSITDVTGVLDVGAGSYTILPDPATPPTVGANMSAVPAAPAGPNEFTVAAFNLQRFYDTANDPSTSDVVLTPTAFANRLNKASLAIRNVLNMPDILGVEEMENLTTLQALADKVNNDAVGAGQPNPNYQAYLFEGNDVGGIDVGFLVKAARVSVTDVTQEGKDATYFDPTSLSLALLNDRPPLLLRAVVGTSPMSMPVTVIVNHLRSLISVDDPVDGPRVRAKREAGAEFLANLIQDRQAADPLESIVSIGDYNAFEVNDGYGDIIGVIRGNPAPADQDVLAGAAGLVSPLLTDLMAATADQRYSYVETGNAQILDHVLVNSTLLSSLDSFTYARNNADFPEVYRSDASRPERISDHDIPVAYFTLVDSTPPTVQCGSADADWHADNVSIPCTARDGGSGLANPADASFSLSTSVAAGAANGNASTGSRSVCDAQTNCATAGPVGGNMIDRKPPVVAVTGVTDGAFYTLGSSIPVAGCSTSDADSGVAANATISVTGGLPSGVGQFTATCSGARDNVGNVTPDVKAMYTVGYGFSGFLAPLDLARSFKLGSTIPVKWQLSDAGGHVINTLGAVTTIQAVPNSACSGQGDGTAVDAGTSGNSGLRTDGSQFIFTWQTRGLAGGCYNLAITLDDTTTHSVVVSLKP